MGGVVRQTEAPEVRARDPMSAGKASRRRLRGLPIIARAPTAERSPLKWATPPWWRRNCGADPESKVKKVKKFNL